MFKHNLGSTVNLIWCTGDIVNSVYDSNEGSQYGGALTLFSTVIHTRGSEFKNIIGATRGGAIMCDESVITFGATSTFTNNYSLKQEGVIYLNQSACFVDYGAKVIVANNTASFDGGGIYLSHHSNLTLHSQSMLRIVVNRATEHGGGIYISEYSSINAAAKLLNNNTNSTIIYLHKNKSSKGGGLYLDFNSIVYIFKCLNNTIIFHKNSTE